MCDVTCCTVSHHLRCLAPVNSILASHRRRFSSVATLTTAYPAVRCSSHASREPPSAYTCRGPTACPALWCEPGRKLQVFPPQGRLQTLQLYHPAHRKSPHSPMDLSMASTIGFTTPYASWAPPASPRRPNGASATINLAGVVDVQVRNPRSPGAAPPPLRQHMLAGDTPSSLNTYGRVVPLTGGWCH